MKLLVVSDSHGCLEGMRQAIVRESPDQILHLGDYVRDADALHREYPQIPMVRVPGNCDGRTDLPEEVLICIEGVPLFLCHGHQYQVKQTYYRAMLAAKQAGGQALLFGHTHQQYCEVCDGLWMLNPGSCSYAKFIRYGIVMVENGQLVCYNVSN